MVTEDQPEEEEEELQVRKQTTTCTFLYESRMYPELMNTPDTCGFSESQDISTQIWGKDT